MRGPGGERPRRWPGATASTPPTSGAMAIPGGRRAASIRSSTTPSTCTRSGRRLGGPRTRSWRTHWAAAWRCNTPARSRRRWRRSSRSRGWGGCSGTGSAVRRTSGCAIGWRACASSRAASRACTRRWRPRKRACGKRTATSRPSSRGNSRSTACGPWRAASPGSTTTLLVRDHPTSSIWKTRATSGTRFAALFSSFGARNRSGSEWTRWTSARSTTTGPFASRKRGIGCITTSSRRSCRTSTGSWRNESEAVGPGNEPARDGPRGRRLRWR